MVRARPDPVRGHDRRLPRLSQARAVPLRDRVRLARPAAPAKAARGRLPGQRGLPRRPDSRRVRIPADRVRQDRIRDLPGQLPARHAAGAGDGRTAVPRRHDPSAETLRSPRRPLGSGHDHPVPAARHRLVVDVLRGAAGRALRGHRPALVRRRRTDRVRGGRLVSRHAHSPRSRPRRGLVASAGPEPLPPRRRQLPARQLDVRPGRRRHVRPGLRPGRADRPRHQLQPPAGAPDRHDLRGHHGRARSVRRGGRDSHLPAVRGPRVQDGTAGARLILDPVGDGC